MLALFEETFLFGCHFSSECDEEDCVLGEDFFEVEEDRLSEDCLGDLS